MNPNTGEIKKLEDFKPDEPKIEIPKEDVKRVIKMNRKQRRAWAARKKKKK